MKYYCKGSYFTRNHENPTGENAKRNKFVSIP